MAPSAGNLGPVGLAPEREKLMATGLPDNVIDTIQSTRAASTQGLYTLKWRMFEAWYTERSALPFQSSVVDILTFLQELLERGLSYSTIKVDLPAIPTCHVGFQGTSPGFHPLVVQHLMSICWNNLILNCYNFYMRHFWLIQYLTLSTSFISSIINQSIADILKLHFILM